MLADRCPNPANANQLNRNGQIKIFAMQIFSGGA